MPTKGQVALLLTGVVVIALLALMSSPEDSVPEIRMSIYGAEISEDDFVEDTSLVQGQAEKKVLDAIVALNAYCTLAYDVAKDFKDTHTSATDTSMVNFIIEYGAPENAKKNIVTAYSDAMGKLKGKFDGGIGLYLLEHMHNSILAGTSLVTDATVGSMKRTLMSHKALGLEKRPKYFEKLSVSRSLFINANLKLEAANANADAQAAAAWLKKGAKDTFRSFRQQAEQVEKDKVIKYKEEQYKEALEAIKNNFEENGDLDGLPRAGGSGASKVAPVQIISDEEIEANAKKKADEWIKANADRDTIDEEANDANDEVIAEDNKKEAEKMIDAQPTIMFSSMRFTPTKVRNDAKANSVQVAEFQFQFKGKAVSVADCTTTNPNGDNPRNEEPPKGDDGNVKTKWLDFHKGAIVIHCDKPRNVDKWTWVTANDHTERDPVPWKAEVQFVGSSDWNTVTEEDDYAVTTKRRTNCCGDKWFDIAQPAQQLTCDAAAPSAIKCFGEDSCFALVDTKSSFDKAQCQCKRLSGTLACFTSQQEEDAVVDWWKTTSDVDGWDAKMWFGLNDEAHEGIWKCGGGTPAYSHWRKGEPNDMGGEDCAEVSKYGGYKWEDMQCSKPLPFVCSVPKPDNYVDPTPKIEEESEPEPPVTKCVQDTTGNDQKYKLAGEIPGDANGDWEFELDVSAKNDAHVAISTSSDFPKGDDKMYELVLGGWGNSRVCIRKQQQGHCSANVNSKIMQGYNTESKIIFKRTGSTLSISGGAMKDPLVWNDYGTIKDAKYIGIMTGWGSTGSWNVCGLKEDQEEVQLFDESIAEKFKNYGADDVVDES